MDKRVKYLLICLPFFCGVMLFILGFFNLFSSLLVFVGGYVVLKKIFTDKKRKLNNNDNDKIMPEVKSSYEKDYSYRNAENIIGIKRTIRHSKVRKRVK